MFTLHTICMFLSILPVSIFGLTNQFFRSKVNFNDILYVNLIAFNTCYFPFIFFYYHLCFFHCLYTLCKKKIFFFFLQLFTGQHRFDLFSYSSNGFLISFFFFVIFLTCNKLILPLSFAFFVVVVVRRPNLSELTQSSKLLLVECRVHS